MKNLLLVALIGLTIAACSKKTTDAVTPDAANAVAGTYNLTLIRFDSAAIPYFSLPVLPLVRNGATVASGTMTATRITADSVKIDVHVSLSGYQDANYSYGTFGLKQSGAAYTLTGSSKSGYTSQASTIDGKTLNIDVSYPDDANPKVNDRDVLIGVR